MNKDNPIVTLRTVYDMAMETRDAVLKMEAEQITNRRFWNRVLGGGGFITLVISISAFARTFM